MRGFRHQTFQTQVHHNQPQDREESGFFVFSVAKPIPNAQKGSGRSYEKWKKKKGLWDF
jgi:hypothetical protein